MQAFQEGRNKEWLQFRIHLKPAVNQRRKRVELHKKIVQGVRFHQFQSAHQDKRYS